MSLVFQDPQLFVMLSDGVEQAVFIHRVMALLVRDMRWVPLRTWVGISREVPSGASVWLALWSGCVEIVSGLSFAFPSVADTGKSDSCLAPGFRSTRFYWFPCPCHVGSPRDAPALSNVPLL